MMMSKEIHSAADFEKEIINHKGYALVDFWATWCPPCRMMAPVLESAEQQLGDKINFVKVDVDEQQQLATEFDIMSIPTLVVFKDGKPVKRMSGYRPLDAFVEELKSAVES
ncbi:thioredoxin [Dialister invisus]|uniref:thioredoxin n=1 Tax=Dialister invisus TaxID=218538 RepID=UPI001D07D326|nr:thioredoxin [Dialister invisus]MCB6181647.1 thioredoxin [Dialister invisus]MEE1473521.1 thioredoxin [Dialister invisus]